MTKPGILSICFLIIVALPLSGCEERAEPVEQKPLRPVKTQTLALPEEGAWKEFAGVVEAARAADIGFRVAGRLERILVKEGESVAAEQLLAQLDATDYEIEFKARQAEFDQASADFKRGETLVAKGLIARTDFDKLKAQYESARAALDAGRQNIEYTSLRAPFSGRIAERYVENYEEVSARQAVFTLQDTAEMSIHVDIPESVMIRAQRGAEPELYAQFDQIPQRRFALSVREVSTQADRSTNTYGVTLSLPSVADYNLLPGMSVTVRARPDERLLQAAEVLYVPSLAVLEDGRGRYAFVVRETEAGKGIVERREVVTGQLTGLGLAVVSGLAVGDRLVIAGMSKMTPGLEVRLLPGESR
ncbi:efflux RND transporter periplasmic adaptor subunit [Marinobacterium rhizophilum]|uniref:efflux RND transporter periplasmic adaptor subunit n=1 Tax=Marinobacterium rhizophilum TaxID=420402 RepID=UPI0003705ED8|nr:efflux RND transporter periplasmic adaptor subunit [Marinobacterium rhizophilum]